MKTRLKASITTLAALFSLWGAPAVGQELQFYPFVDTTYWPPFDFEKAVNEGIKSFSLAFVNSAGQCSPRWGTYDAYTIENTTLNMPQKIEEIKNSGGSVFISFGGAAAGNYELPAVCSTVEELKSAYREVIEKTGVFNLDFDVEGVNLTATDRVEKRLEAIKALQEEFPQLKVTFTLPVMPEGLTQEGLALLEGALARGIAFERVNIMAMDYGEAYPATEPGQMAEYAKEAVEAVNGQLKELFTKYQVEFEGELYGKIGVISMIGRNDVLNEWFYPEDAAELRNFCLEKGVGMLSMWSMNRDRPIGEDEPEDSQLYLSTKLSPQEYGEGEFVFAKILGGITELNEEAPAEEGEEPDETSETPEEPQDELSYSVELVDYWSSGAQYRVEVGSGDWKMEVKIADGEISDIWDAEIESSDGNTFTVVPADWFSGSFGFNTSGANPIVVEITLNGQSYQITYPSDGARYEITITDEWDTGYTAQVRVVNDTEHPIFDWQVAIKTTSTITSAWGFTPERVDSETVIARPVDYTRLVKPGESVEFGFVAEKGGELPYPSIEE